MAVNKRNGGLELVESSENFFRELLSDALSQKRLKPSAETEIYLVNLLNRFVVTDHLFSRDQEGRYRDETLVALLKEALEQPEIRTKSLIFRQLGDLSLYKAGFFHEYISRKSVNLGYYMEMGGVAYQNAATLSNETTNRQIYSELSSQFPYFVDVFSAIKTNTTPKTESNLLRMCQTWLENENPETGNALKEAGISLEALRASQKISNGRKSKKSDSNG